MRRPYTPEELEQLLLEVNAGTPVEEIIKTLGRTSSNLRGKLQTLSKSDPTTWNPEKVHRYVAKLGGEEWNSAKKNPERVERSRQKVLDYLREHPDANKRELVNAGLSFDFFVSYDGRISVSRRELGLEERARGGRPIDREQRRQQLLTYFREHPNATTSDIIKAGYRFYMQIYNGIDGARRDAGLINDEYIPLLEAARMLHRTRQRASQLFKSGQLDGYRLGRSVYVSLVSVNKQMLLQASSV